MKKEIEERTILVAVIIILSVIIAGMLISNTIKKSYYERDLRGELLAVKGAGGTGDGGTTKTLDCGDGSCSGDILENMVVGETQVTTFEGKSYTLTLLSMNYDSQTATLRVISPISTKTITLATGQTIIVDGLPVYFKAVDRQVVYENVSTFTCGETFDSCGSDCGFNNTNNGNNYTVCGDGVCSGGKTESVYINPSRNITFNYGGRNYEISLVSVSNPDPITHDVIVGIRVNKIYGELLLLGNGGRKSKIINGLPVYVTACNPKMGDFNASATLFVGEDHLSCFDDCSSYCVDNHFYTIFSWACKDRLGNHSNYCEGNTAVTWSCRFGMYGGCVKKTQDCYASYKNTGFCRYTIPTQPLCEYGHCVYPFWCDGGYGGNSVP